ncbi:Uncharacterised protein [Mesomycoplasma conjunctivae]|uniref:Uncharacterized protein n=1 Tax=Mesomycoplasma conjunctivae (strain ATCC 25834 / NCTC 10147 / HRC/581) TaxID=572263 RepID=C5J5Q5_MESCH|nr:hypothetical protein [Mesomycoplasma conjunctivae]CAT04785.1 HYPOTHETICAL PROTEIN MCJ_001040 [Mesomycoplasma conjunctivae]VEU65811.1 Uncharacterised protein [Mesomycoplasma conjunctivae]
MTPINIAIYSLAGILALILIFVIVKRLVTKPEKSTKSLISTTKETIDSLKIINASTDSSVMTNLLVKNRFSKLNYSIIPGLIVTKESIFVVSNIIPFNKSVEKIIISDDIYSEKNNKKQKWNYFDKKEFDNIVLLINKKYNNAKYFILVSDKIELSKINNQSEYKLINQSQLINNINQEVAPLQNPKIIVQYFSSINRFDKNDRN